jgi:mono/diheme cytochrome c family protein
MRDRAGQKRAERGTAVAALPGVKSQGPLRCALACLAWGLASACSDQGSTDTSDSDPSDNAYREVLPAQDAGPATADPIARASATDLAREPNSVDWSGGDAGHGQALFAQHCALCHGGAGHGDGIASPALNPKPRDFSEGRYYIDASANNQTGEDVDLARVILHGPRSFGGTLAMPAYEGTLSESDVRDLIAHLRALAS